MKHTVLLTGASDDRAMEHLISSGLSAVRYDGDCADRDALAASLEQIADDLLGVVHFLPQPRALSIEKANEDDWQAALEEGALASMMTAQTACERMAQSGGGALIFVGTIHAEKPMGYGFLHSMANSATQMLAREAAMQYGCHGVNAFFVMRGPRKEEEALASDVTNVYRRPDLRYPPRRYPDPNDLYALIEYLLTPAARVLSGSCLSADGGYTLYYGQKREASI